MTFNSNQEQFWAETYADEYIKRNSQFDHPLGAKAWQSMLNKVANNINNYLECGCNIGRNITQLGIAYPQMVPSIIEISEPAYQFVTQQHQFDQKFNGAILGSDFLEDSFDLVFTMGVLIHINPDQLLAHMAKMHQYSKRYVLMGEYFNRTPVSIEYRGEQDKLFKRDFGKLYLENFDVKIVDYGFLWGHLYDKAGFDDITWWLFEKN